jgi:pyruvate dehydrogenase E2 component (dihydrolipoamide acetyltransferase)
MPDVVMPRLSDSMEEGTVLAWMKAVGDEVAVGDELVEIETDKANMVYESDVAGTLTEILAEEGATLPIGEVIARVGGEAAAAGETAPAAEEDGGRPAEQAASSRQQAASDAEPPAASERPEGRAEPGRAAGSERSEGERAPSSADGDGGRGRVKASPLARRIARERGVELAGLSGSGPGGRIVKADVEGAPAPGGDGAAAAPPEVPGPPAPPGAAERPETARGGVEIVELSKLQQTVARRMAESKATAPHFYLTTEIDMTRAWDARATIKAAATEGDVVPSFNDMVVKACAIALREFPRANGSYRDGKVEQYSRVNVGVAVAARDALVVPTVFDADAKGLRAIATETRRLAERVRDGTITPPELSGGTFTVSNLGMFGVTSFSAVINPPQAGILAVGSIEEAAVVRDGEIAARRRMSVDLACDHRILYGADGARFLARIRDLLQEPVFLAM